LIARLIFGLQPDKTGFKPVIDRTNWQFGVQNINIFMLGIAYRNVAFPLMFTFLDEKLHTFGTLTLSINTDVDPRELYEKYKQHNEIEVMFDSYKNFLKADRIYMQNRMVLEGWLMANFLAMIAYYKLHRKLVEAKELNNY
jgi:hypothetical protein